MKKISRKLTISLILIAIAVFISGCVLFASKSSKKTTYDYTEVKRGDLTQKVSVTGQVKPIQSFNLAFERGGRISKVYANTNDKVKAGQTLVILENGDLAAQLSQAQANFEVEKIRLEELKKGARLEDVQIAETKVSNTERTLEDAEKNLENVKTKADTDLENAYSSAINAAQKSVSAAKASLLTLTDIQYAHFMHFDSDRNSSQIADAKQSAVAALLGVSNAGSWATNLISNLTSGTYGTVQNAVNDPTPENIDRALSETADSLQKVKNSLDAVLITDSVTVSEKTNLAAEKSNIAAEISNIAAKQESIITQKAINKNNITLAETNINNVKNALASAKDELALKKVGPTAEQVMTQETRIKSAQATIQNIQAQLAKTVISSPIDGIVTKQNAKVGEIAPPSTPIVSLISETKFEIEADIPEVDVAKVKIGNLAKITLDAYGNSAVFDAVIVTIDPTETINNGVATYKATLQFTSDDERIKSGMTANVDILSAKKENVIIVPGQAIITKNGEKFVLVDSGKNNPEERKIETGITGLDGNVEVISGLTEGEKISNFGKN